MCCYEPNRAEALQPNTAQTNEHYHSETLATSKHPYLHIHAVNNNTELEEQIRNWIRVSK